MESITKKITWILKDVTLEKLKTHDTFKRIVSDYFTVVFGGRIYDKWYLATYTKDRFITFRLHYHIANLDDNLNISVKFFCGQQLMRFLEAKGEIFQAHGYGFSKFISLNNAMTHVDKNKNLSLGIEMTITKADANNKVEVTPQSNVVRENYAEFLDDESVSDASFMCSDGVKVSAHRVLLIKKSTAFKTIFDNMKAQRKKIHHLKEIDSITLKEVLKYIYSGNVTLVDIHLIKKIHKAAVEFDLAELQLQCVDALTNLIDTENVLDIFEISNSLKLKQLEEKALQSIVKLFHILKSTPKWSQMSVKLKDKVINAVYGHLPSIVLQNIL